MDLPSVVISSMEICDVRFPTTLEGDGSDAVNDPDYSCTYVILKTNSVHTGHGMTFTIGRGNEIVCAAVKAYSRFVIGRDTRAIFTKFGSYWHELTQEPQLRWLGPEKGVTHLAVAAIINALWDLWARMAGKPVWKLLADMTPEQIVSLIDFTYIDDYLSQEKALEMLREGEAGKEEREAEVLANGYPAYVTSAGWLGYSDDKVKRLLEEYCLQGFTRFKVKVGVNREEDDKRLAMVRKELGDDKLLMVDANQRWGVNEAIAWMEPLAKYRLLWIEEPTSPDDVLGHATIAKAMAPLGMGVATGEACQNRVMFKQFLQAGALQFCQIDSCRLGGVNEILSVYLMARINNVPVCPHAGGVGLCEFVRHLQIFDYISISCTKKNRIIEFSDHLHEHFTDPAQVRGGNYLTPTMPGYSGELKVSSLTAYEYPRGTEWQRLFKEGHFTYDDQ